MWTLQTRDEEAESEDGDGMIGIDGERIGALDSTCYMVRRVVGVERCERMDGRHMAKDESVCYVRQRHYAA